MKKQLELQPGDSVKIIMGSRQFAHVPYDDMVKILHNWSVDYKPTEPVKAVVMKDRVESALIFSASAVAGYAIVYLLLSFILWRFPDPFGWVKIIPQMNPMERLGLVLIPCCWLLFHRFRK